MPPLLTLLAVVLLEVLLLPPAVSAQHETEPEGGHQEHKQSGFHHLGLFLRVTHKESETAAFTTGLDYSYRLAPPVGFVALVDNPHGDFRDGIFAVGFAIYPFGEAFVLFAPGYEFQEHAEPEILYRLGVGYDLFVIRHRLFVAPAFNLDFVGDETVIVNGLGFGVALGG
jgi:hypothetical protein